MKKNLLVMALSVLIAGGPVGAAFAQTTDAPRKEERKHRNHKGESKSPEEHAKARTERLTQQLDLSKSQARKVEALYLKQAKEREMARAQHTKGEKRNPHHREQIKAARAQHQAELKGILSKKQYAQYEKHRQEMKAKRKEAMQHRGKGHGQKHRS